MPSQPIKPASMASAKPPKPGTGVGVATGGTTGGIGVVAASGVMVMLPAVPLDVPTSLVRRGV